MAKWTLAVLLLLSSIGSFGFLKCIMKLVIKSIMKSLVRFSHRGITTGCGCTALLTPCNNCGALTEVIQLECLQRLEILLLQHVVESSSADMHPLASNVATTHNKAWNMVEVGDCDRFCISTTGRTHQKATSASHHRSREWHWCNL